MTMCLFTGARMRLSYGDEVYSSDVYRVGNTYVFVRAALPIGYAPETKVDYIIHLDRISAFYDRDLPNGHLYAVEAEDVEHVSEKAQRLMEDSKILW